MRLSSQGLFEINSVNMGFPDSSVGKESACNAGDPGSIPGLGRSPGEGKGYPLQYSGLENSMDCIVHGGHKVHALSNAIIKCFESRKCDLCLKYHKGTAPSSSSDDCMWVC